MCNVKYGADVKHQGDLQNLVTSVILRQIEQFTVESIYEEVSQKLVGSIFVNDVDVKKRCENTIDQLFNIGSLKTTNSGAYELSMGWPSINKR